MPTDPLPAAALPAPAPRPSPAPAALRPLARALEPLFRAAVKQRNRAFDQGRRVQHAPVPVVSVGNLSVGGAGKTPTVAWVVNVLRDSGHRPAIALRGHGARAEPDGPADEHAELAALFPDITIIADPDRAGAVQAAHERDPAFDCVVLDDGFQHRFLARDMDIVLLDATRDPFHDRCLPAGWLREPVESLVRADAIVVTHAERAPRAVVDSILMRAARIAKSAVLAVARHEWTAIDAPDRRHAVDELRGKRIAALCGVGNPDTFLAQVRDLAELVDSTVLRDHAPFTPALLRDALDRARGARADALLVTPKDWTKIAPILRDASRDGDPPVLRPVLRIRIEHAEPDLRGAILRACASRR